jgi:transposase
MKAVSQTATIPVISYSEAARRLGVDRRTIADLCRKYEFGDRPHPHGNAKGLTDGEVAALARLLSPRQTA